MFRILRTQIGARRQLHDVPALAQHAGFAQNGIRGLYSPEGYAAAWVQYQKYLAASLTLHTSGTRYEGSTALQTLLSTAKRTTEQHIFHYASQAHNNHFFFEQLADREVAQATRPSRFLLERMTDTPTVDALKREVVRLAEAAHGQGWVFLVEQPDKSVRLVSCNNDGTPYYYGKNQGVDLNGSVDEATFEAMAAVQRRSGAREKDFTLPLMAISFWDVSYYTDYGLTGKTQYLERVLDCINWDVVNKRMFQL